MNLKKIENCERSRIERWAGFQLDHKWKIRGLILSALLIVSLIVIRFLESDVHMFMESEYVVHKFLLRRLLLISLLVVSLSKDRIEDEMVTSLRAKSFTLAFIIAILYAIIQPVVNIIAFYLFDKEYMTADFSYFQVLSFMLILQILFFEVLKRSR